MNKIHFMLEMLVKEKENLRKLLMIGNKLLLEHYRELQDLFPKNSRNYGIIVKVYGLNNGN